MKPSDPIPTPGPSATPPAAPSPGPRSSRRFRLSHNVLIVIAIIILGTAAAAWSLAGRHQRSDSRQSAARQTPAAAPSGAFAQQYLSNCRERTVTFTHSPVPLDQLGYLEPLGKVSDGHVTPTDHVYLAPKDQRAADNTYDVVMPADGTVVGVSAMPAQYIGDRQQQTAPQDHRLVIAHNCRYVSIFIHVHQLSPALQAAIGERLAPNTQKQLNLELSAGAKLGKIGGNPVDWTLADATQSLSGFITPSLYAGEPWKIHVIDPLSVYSGALKQQLAAASLRTTEPYGGKIDHDRRGALVGNWFREGTNGYAGADQSRYWDGHLSIAPHYIDPMATTVSLGNWQGKASQFSAKSGPDPASVTSASGRVKIELIDMSYLLPDGQPWLGGAAAVKGMKVSLTGAVRGTVLVQVLEGERLKVELFPGKTATQVTGFTSAAQIYVR